MSDQTKASPSLSADGKKIIAQSAIVTLIVGLILTALVFVMFGSLSGSADDAVAQAQADGGSTASLQQLADDVASTSSTVLLMMIVIVVLGSVAAGAASMLSARRSMSPVSELHAAATEASAAFPAFARALANGSDELPPLHMVEVGSDDAAAEEIADSINQIQRHAAALAVTQVRLRSQDAERFVDLGQRSEQLLINQMNLIDAMQQEETNASNLQRLFKIDHLASRMRRTAASTLVLAGRDTPRQLQQPVSVHQVIQAASSGVEHFERIIMSDLSEVAVNGTVAADLAHMLSELLANATTSSPDLSTAVNGAPTADGYLIEIVDQGAGMSPQDLAAANAAFVDPERVGSGAAAPANIGFAVIARLASRHQVQISLSDTSGGGVTAQIHLPQILLARVPKRVAQTPTPAPETPAVAAEAPMTPAERMAAPAAATDAAMVVEDAPQHEVIHASTLASANDPKARAAAAAQQADAGANAISSQTAPASPVAADGSDVIATDERTAGAQAVIAPAPPDGTQITADAAAPTSPAPAPAPAAADPETAAAAELAERWAVLAQGQRAAIEWAMDTDGRGSDERSGDSNQLRPGPVRAETLADLEASLPDLQPRTGV